ncbi:hypothetical protein [Bacillus paramycoides]|uniref:Uncharacterized protein n=1 Tax=Bacillus paramycoides TaxID=2026194 RepID=A0ABU6MWP5_9BACI|nr:hypothetical protein [Bacillus paramycoides]MED0980300.1 hypothetical protein [Bacillus paramycoides]MED0985371.1 hypothetical protein [Bacillus paramycoides]MED1091717.1 hypothetical protein [Bacillus paramycoides]MED1104404.1 hypothetical protein [Bacillus paramycoides]
MVIQRLFDEINQQNFYIEQILFKSIELIETQKNKKIQPKKRLMFEYNLVVLSDFLVTKINLINRKKNMYIHLLSTLNGASSIKEEFDPSISYHLINKLKEIKFTNEIYRIRFNKNIHQLELNAFINDTKNLEKLTRKFAEEKVISVEQNSPSIIVPWLNKNI